MKLQTDGLQVLTPDGMRALKMDFHIGADLSSIWKSTGIGSAMAEETCLYCLISKLERQIPGNAKCDLSNKDMWRRGADGKLLSIFGLESIPKIHLCSLHGLTRISEKLMKLLAVATVFQQERIDSFLVVKGQDLDKAKVALRKTKEDITNKERLERRNKVTRSQEDKAQDIQKLADATAKVSEKQLELTIASERTSHGGTIQDLSKAMLDADIGRSSFKIETKPKKNSEGIKLEMSTLTGEQSLRLLGRSRMQIQVSKALGPCPPLPFTKVIHAALYDCGHPEEHGRTGSLEVGHCPVCNVHAVFYQFSQLILPVLQATTQDELNKLGFEHGAFYATCKAWGDLLVATFSGVGNNTQIISDYMHAVIEHSAFLIKEGGPLGYWSQQAIEAAHKILKQAWSRSSAHDGGRPGAQQKSTHQIVMKSKRILVSETRRAANQGFVTKFVPQENTPGRVEQRPFPRTPREEAWRRIALDAIGMSQSEQERARHALRRTVQRVHKGLKSVFACGGFEEDEVVVEETEQEQDDEVDSEDEYAGDGEAALEHFQNVLSEIDARFISMDIESTPQ